MAPLEVALKALAAGSIIAYLDAKHQIAHDLHMAGALVKATVGAKLNDRRDTNSVWWVFHWSAQKRPSAVCYICDGRTYTWGEVETITRRLARILLSKGLKRKDVVALYMENKPAYLFIWLACMSIDVIPGFINYNLTGQGFAHCVGIAKCKYLLFDADLEANVAEIAERVGQEGTALLRWHDIFCKTTIGAGKLTCETIDDVMLSQMSSAPVSQDYIKGIGWQDPACLVFTSGTTGLPKPASCTHGRIGAATTIWAHLDRFASKDVIYTPMPLYHSTAAFLAAGVSWRVGCALAIGRKFSATRFWNEVRAANATAVQYVGEVGRYLLSVPPSPQDRQHRVRVAYGNGMRPDVVEKFKERFGIPVVAEFFASTEGNGSLFNWNTGMAGVGAVGRQGTLVSISQRKSQPIVKVDAITEEPARDSKGFCILADVNEPGELLCFIDPNSAFKNFKGYHGNDEATEKKILRNVFTKGDAYFRTGDLLRQDADGYIYFSDRMGDTFRFKSENVSTAEVAAAMGEVIEEANVYGVQLPSVEGRVGCAAIPPGGATQLDDLAVHVTKRLPSYARPIFLRIVPVMAQTGTAKQLKVALRTEGVDPLKVTDPIFWLKEGRYVPFAQGDWDAITAGKIKL